MRNSNLIRPLSDFVPLHEHPSQLDVFVKSL
jgi:hypothetical protein